MKWQTKSNQFSITRSEFHAVKVVEAIKIDSEKETINYLKIEDCIEYIQKSLDFFNYDEILVSDELDILVVGVDKDLKSRSSFLCKKNNRRYHGNAMVIRVPKSGNLQKLKNTKLDLEIVKRIIDFD